MTKCNCNTDDVPWDRMPLTSRGTVVVPRTWKGHIDDLDIDQDKRAAKLGKRRKHEVKKLEQGDYGSCAEVTPSLPRTNASLTVDEIWLRSSHKPKENVDRVELKLTGRKTNWVCSSLTLGPPVDTALWRAMTTSELPRQDTNLSANTSISARQPRLLNLERSSPHSSAANLGAGVKVSKKQHERKEDDRLSLSFSFLALSVCAESSGHTLRCSGDLTCGHFRGRRRTIVTYDTPYPRQKLDFLKEWWAGKSSNHFPIQLKGYEIRT